MSERNSCAIIYCTSIIANIGCNINSSDVIIAGNNYSTNIDSQAIINA